MRLFSDMEEGLLTKGNDARSGIKDNKASEIREGTYGGCRYRLDYAKYEKGDVSSSVSSNKYKMLKYIAAFAVLMAIGYLLYQYFGEEIVSCINNMYA